jgi:glycosyltransferase involved in cell wall biosynthesis
MIGSPPVSVIMGVFNCEATVAASVRSILDQDFHDFEFIICDDGSGDSTADVVQSLSAKDNRIVFMRNDRNMGLSRTLMRCIGAARGTYLARMDGDDISRPERLGKQFAFLEANPGYDFCGSSILLFDASGIWGKLDYPEKPEARDFLLRSPYAHPSVVFRASCVKAAGGYDCDPAIGRSEDYDLFMRLHAAGSRGYNFQDFLFEYREELGSFRKRKFRYAITEARVRFRGFRKLGLLPLGLPYVIKPILIGLIPKGLYTRIRKAAFK